MVLALLCVLAGAGCTGDAEEADDTDPCVAIAAAVDAGALDDGLVDPFGGAPALADALDRAAAAARDAGAAAARDAGASASSSTSSAWDELAGALDGADAELADAGYDLVAVASTPAEQTPATTALGGDQVTSLRQALAADARSRCGLDVAEPTTALGPLVVDPVVAPPGPDPRTAEPLSLDAGSLAALIARTYAPDELRELLRAASVRSVSELAGAALAGAPGTEGVADDLRRRRGAAELGDDEALDGWADGCDAGDGGSCDVLAALAPEGSEYARVAATCGGRRQPTGQLCGTPPPRNDDDVSGFLEP